MWLRLASDSIYFAPPSAGRDVSKVPETLGSTEYGTFKTSSDLDGA